MSHMESGQDGTVYPEEDLLDDDDSQEDEEEEDDDVLGEPEDDEENEPSPSTSSAVAIADASTAVTVAVPGSGIPNGVTNPIQSTTAMIVVSDSDPKPLHNEEKKPLDDSRRLFQRLWTDEDEIELLQGFLDYTTQRGSSHHNDTALFYDQIKSKLQLDFNKNQLVEKLRRLKKKYRNVVSKISSGKEFSFKSPHDQATFEISRKIWSNIGRISGDALDDDELNPNRNLNFSHSVVKNEEMVGHSVEKKTPSSRKRSRSRPGIKTDEKRELTDGLVSNKDNTFYSHINNDNYNSNIPGLVEETVRSCLSPLFKELLTSAMGGPFGARGLAGLQLNPMPLSFGGPSIMNFGSGEMVDDKWRKQQILELEVYSKRLELVQDQIKAALEELRSKGGG
ncbi:mediator-associated protein 1-like [Quillaja saponaria]|uniref:Mediator-associated protein 1-like n=1 Tax=Quillaja saponaria TaxID=32244 RepID=A0AAD7VF68_QUISA|nr:mediator-associated protein 1-like [Quillaja saponaria]KAJ7973449.1 mediator-associated protein 1-like [Quillaja saponaria]